MDFAIALVCHRLSASSLQVFLAFYYRSARRHGSLLTARQ